MGTIQRTDQERLCIRGQSCTSANLEWQKETLRSTVTEVKDDSLAQLSFSLREFEEIDHFRQTKVPNIYSVHQVQRNIHCINCSRRIIQVSAARIIHCDRCGHSMRAENCCSQVCAKFTLLTPQGENIVVTTFGDTLTVNVQNVSSLSETKLAEVLLLIENVTVKYDDCKGTKCLISFKTVRLR